MVSTPCKVIAFVFALTAFAVAVVAGMSVGDAAEYVLGRALVAMFVGYAFGGGLGVIVNHVLNEYLRKYQNDRPIPEVPERAKVAAPPGAGTGGSGGGSI